ncbi:MAG: hypothetical protein KatS3mg034_0708 [Vicingaceae bacterium]|nr:MAG: hypothetical protein KatS3mg034_0708 [Vicingaceae bacterium]
MSNIKIRKVTTNDLKELQKIGRLTFYETFASDNTEENMNKYLDEALDFDTF